MSYLLETYEWDNTWIEKSADNKAKRVLYIGDSISCGTRTFANKLSDGKVLFDGFGTSKALDNPYFFNSLSLFSKQEPRRDAVLFNNGLHGWHLDEAEYKALYEKFLDNLIAEFQNTPLYVVLTTFVTNEEYHNDRVIERNRIALKAASDRGLPIIDLYSVSEKNSAMLRPDGVHFSDEGYTELAKEVLIKL